MTLPDRRRRTEFVQIRLDKRVKTMLAADARRRGVTMSALLVMAWQALPPPVAALFPARVTP